jgi:outer membrane protein insertion porin family
MINNLSVEFAGLGGTSRFLKYIGETTYFRPVIWSTVFSLRGTLGYIQGLGKELPIDEKFYLGGINTLRGFKSRSVSPTIVTKSTTPDVNGVFSESTAFIGGNKEAVLNAELTFPLLKDVGLKGVTFFDIGNSYGEGEALMSSFRASYGGGIRWFSPIGPLRLEYGIPINPRDGIDSKSGKLEFSIGAFF